MFNTFLQVKYSSSNKLKTIENSRDLLITYYGLIQLEKEKRVENKFRKRKYDCPISAIGLWHTYSGALTSVETH